MHKWVVVVAVVIVADTLHSVYIWHIRVCNMHTHTQRTHRNCGRPRNYFSAIKKAPLSWRKPTAVAPTTAACSNPFLYVIVPETELFRTGLGDKNGNDSTNYPSLLHLGIVCALLIEWKRYGGPLISVPLVICVHYCRFSNHLNSAKERCVRVIYAPTYINNMRCTLGLWGERMHTETDICEYNT